MGTLIFWIIVGFCIFLFNREDCSKSVVKSKRRKATIVSNFPVDEDKKDGSKQEKKYLKNTEDVVLCVEVSKMWKYII